MGVVFELALSFSHDMPAVHNAVHNAVDAAKATVLAAGDIHLGDLPVRLLGPRIAGLSHVRTRVAGARSSHDSVMSSVASSPSTASIPTRTIGCPS